MSFRSKLAPLAFILALASCGGDDDGEITDPNDLEGTFSANFSGSYTATMEGTATFASIQGTGFALTLLGQGGSGALSIARNSIGRPGNGTVTVGDASQGTPGIMYVSGSVGNNAFISVSGTLTITSSSSSVLRGNFSIQGTDAEAGNVTLSGTFEARCIAIITGYCD